MLFTQLQQTFETPQVKDIIVYVDANGGALHSEIVYSISAFGDLTICSKWGQGGVYEHSLFNVPIEYTVNGGHQTNENWLIVACSGLSCVTPWSIRSTAMKY